MPAMEPASKSWKSMDVLVYLTPIHWELLHGKEHLISRKCETRRHNTFGLNSVGTWITNNGQNVIWLPSEDRPSSFALTSRTMVIGCESGRVLIFDFSNKASL